MVFWAGPGWRPSGATTGVGLPCSWWASGKCHALKVRLGCMIRLGGSEASGRTGLEGDAIWATGGVGVGSSQQ